MKKVEQGLCLILVVAMIMNGFVGFNILQTTEDNEMIFGENMTRGGSYHERANGITEYDGFLYTTGPVGDDLQLLKFDTGGNLIWNRTYGSGDGETSYDLVGHNGFLYIMGRLDDYLPDHEIDIDILLLKFNTNGDLLWSARWGGNESNEYATDLAMDIILHDNSLYIVGSSNHTPLIIKFDLEGNEIWNKTWIGDIYPGGQCTGIASHNETLFILGVMNAQTWPDENYMFLSNYDLDGNEIWNITWENSTPYFGNGTVAPLGIVQLDDRLYITVGPLRCEDRIGLILIYDTDGQVVSIKSFGGSEFRGIGPTIEYNGNIYISGTNRYGIFLREFDVNGNQSWNTTWGNDSSDSVCGVVGYDNYLYLAGSTDNLTAGSDVLLLKYDLDGNLIWNVTWSRGEDDEIDNNNTQSVIINISMAKQQFSINESINVTVNITNNGTENINRDGYCFTFILEHNGTSMELFCPYNASMGTIPPGGNFVQTIDLLEYSSNLDSWEKMSSLPAGNYSLKAVYGSLSNPWYNETVIPYNETVSDMLQFEVGQDSSYQIGTILFGLIMTSVIIIGYGLTRKRQKK